ncbi:MAG: hypothetical protein ACRDOU_02695 [Streptosporangiaceae bacterium]
MTQRTFTHADLEQMAAATAVSNPVPEAEQKTYAPAARAPLAALADGTPATVQELAAAAGRAADETAAILRAFNGVEWDAEGRVTGFGMTLYASADAASGWAAEYPDGVLLTVPDAFHYIRSVMRLFLDA